MLPGVLVTADEPSSSLGDGPMGLCEAAERLDRNRKTLQRWRKRPDAPFSADGTVPSLAALRAWAEEHGLLERQGGRPTAVGAMLVGEPLSRGPGVPERSNPSPEGAKVSPEAKPASAPAAPKPADLPLADLSDEDRQALQAMTGSDLGQLVALAPKVNPKLLQRLAMMARVRRDQADAERRELDNAERRRVLVALDEVRGWWLGQVAVVKAAFAVLPAQLARALEDVTAYDERMALVEGKLDATLAAFAARGPG